MKKQSLLLGITILFAIGLVACGKKEVVNNTTEAVNEVQATQNVNETTGVEETKDLLESLNVTYKGGLYARSEVNDMMLALFDSSGTPIVVITEFDKLYYGQYTTETKKTDDGTEYTAITVENKTYGYNINEDKTGILVDQDGNVYEAKALDVSVATDMVRRTVEGK